MCEDVWAVCRGIQCDRPELSRQPMRVKRLERSGAGKAENSGGVAVGDAMGSGYGRGVCRVGRDVATGVPLALKGQHR